MQYIDKNNIKNIIFDLGGVIMNLDVSKTIKAFENIGIIHIVNKTGQHSKINFLLSLPNCLKKHTILTK